MTVLTWIVFVLNIVFAIISTIGMISENQMRERIICMITLIINIITTVVVSTLLF